MKIRYPQWLPCILVLLLAGFLFVGCRQRATWRVSEGAVWHTTYRIVYESDRDLSDSIQMIFTEVAQSLSPFDCHSLISHINSSDTDSVDTLVAKAFQVAREVNILSHGAFDPTVSPLVNLWGFGFDKAARDVIEGETDDNEYMVPQELIDSALTLVGLADCAIVDGHIIKKRPATTFNFSAVTKGLACDEIVAMMQRQGVENCMVEIGGEIALTGTNRRGEPWHVQIDTPTKANEHQCLTVIELYSGGVATSGNYRNFHDTKAYGRIGHTISPLTGMPVQTDVLSATATAPDAATADAFATAAMALGSHNALNMIDKADSVEILLVVSCGSTDSLQILTSPGFPVSR